MARLLASPALAQNDKMTPIAIPAQPTAITLNTGPLPGATNAESWHSQYGSVFARNVTVATLTPFLPDPAKATGVAVIVAPGGGFRTLSMDNEGWAVAKALADKGVAAFVLKYRLNQTPADMPGFEASMKAMFSGVARAPRMDPQSAVTALAPQLADAPPMFFALAADDPLFGNSGFGLIESWRAAKRPVEFHLYEQGGHGFGMYPKKTTSTGWFDAYTRWMAMHGYMAKK
jgi:acetyl esterase/lipase